jgi:hypothetical protein
MADFIWDRKSGDQIAWIENDHDVYSAVTKQKFATVRDRKLYALDGQFLNLHLENLHGEGADLASSENTLKHSRSSKSW